jgi:hypothetical protein
MIGLDAFGYTIRYKPGKEHQDADGMSRLVDKEAAEAPDNDDLIISLAQWDGYEENLTLGEKYPFEIELDFRGTAWRLFRISMFDNSRLVDQWEDDTLRWLRDIVMTNTELGLDVSTQKLSYA